MLRQKLSEGLSCGQRKAFLRWLICVFCWGACWHQNFRHLGVFVTQKTKMNGSVSLLHQSKPSELEGRPFLIILHWLLRMVSVNKIDQKVGKVLGVLRSARFFFQSSILSRSWTLFSWSIWRDLLNHIAPQHKISLKLQVTWEDFLSLDKPKKNPPKIQLLVGYIAIIVNVATVGNRDCQAKHGGVTFKTPWLT